MVTLIDAAFDARTKMHALVSITCNHGASRCYSLYFLSRDRPAMNHPLHDSFGASSRWWARPYLWCDVRLEFLVHLYYRRFLVVMHGMAWNRWTGPPESIYISTPMFSDRAPSPRPLLTPATAGCMFCIFLCLRQVEGVRVISKEQV